MTVKTIAPALMGSIMGLMMLRLAHDIMTKQSDLAAPALLTFILGHFVVIGLILGLVLWSATFAPRIHSRLKRLHHPSLKHVGQMACFAGAAAFTAHLILHGGL